MRWFLFSSLMVAGCGSVDVTPDPPHASHNPCVTSLGCAAGERCDEGQCVADVGCPGPSAPRVLYENTNDKTSPYITVMNGRENLVRLPHGTAGADTETKFLELATGTTTVLHHAPGSAYCDGDPLSCTVRTTAGELTRLTGVTLDTATNVWSAAASQDLPAGYTTILGTLPDGDLVLSKIGNPGLLSFNPSTGQSKSLLDLGGRSPSTVLTLASGPVLTANDNASPNGSELSFAPLFPVAAWTTILTLPGAFKAFGVSIPAGDEWFVVADPLPSAIPHVWRVSPTSTLDVGASDDPLLPEVAFRYAHAKAVLEGTRGKALVCDGDTCRSGQLDLATISRTPIGSVTLPGVTRSWVSEQRWLACDAVDAIIHEPIFSADPAVTQAVGYRLHAVRVLPDAMP